MSWSPPPGTCVQRSTGLSAYPRDQLATELARQVAARTAPPPPAAPAPAGIPGRGGRRASPAGAIRLTRSSGCRRPRSCPPAGAVTRVRSLGDTARHLYAHAMDSVVGRTLIPVRHAKSSWELRRRRPRPPASGRGRRDAEAVWAGCSCDAALGPIWCCAPPPRGPGRPGSGRQAVGASAGEVRSVERHLSRLGAGAGPPGARDSRTRSDPADARAMPRGSPTWWSTCACGPTRPTGPSSTRSTRPADSR